MNLIDKLHMMHRFWRYRLSTEKDEIKFLLRQNLLGTTILDVGAHRGIYSYWMSKKAGKTGKVIAFEPQPELKPFLDDLKRTFNLYNLIVVNKALSDHSGNNHLHREKIGCGGASFSCTSGEREEVLVNLICLDEYLENKNFPRISLIKLKVDPKVKTKIFFFISVAICNTLVVHGLSCVTPGVTQLSP